MGKEEETELERLKDEEFFHLLEEEIQKLSELPVNQILEFYNNFYSKNIQEWMKPLVDLIERNEYTDLADDLNYLMYDAVQKLNQPEDVKLLIRIFSEVCEGGVQEEATNSLIKLGKIVVDDLIVALQDHSNFGRDNAAYALGQIGDIRAVKPLIQALKDKNEVVRIRAAFALGEIGDDRAVKPLSRLFKSNNSDVKKYASDALDKIAGIEDDGEFWEEEAEWLSKNSPLR